MLLRYGVTANIIAFHAIARGSIPRIGGFLLPVVALPLSMLRGPVLNYSQVMLFPFIPSFFCRTHAARLRLKSKQTRCYVVFPGVLAREIDQQL